MIVLLFSIMPCFLCYVTNYTLLWHDSFLHVYLRQVLDTFRHVFHTSLGSTLTMTCYYLIFTNHIIQATYTNISGNIRIFVIICLSMKTAETISLSNTFSNLINHKCALNDTKQLLLQLVITFLKAQFKANSDITYYNLLLLKFEGVIHFKVLYPHLCRSVLKKVSPYNTQSLISQSSPLSASDCRSFWR